MTENILREIENTINSNKLIIVEGKKDRFALEKLGFNKIFTLNNGKPIKRNAEIISDMSKDAIILTDFDKKGREIYDKLNHELSQVGVRIDNKLRNHLAKKVSHIQGLASFIKAQQSHGKASV